MEDNWYLQLIFKALRSKRRCSYKALPYPSSLLFYIVETIQKFKKKRPNLEDVDIELLATTLSILNHKMSTSNREPVISLNRYTVAGHKY